MSDQYEDVVLTQVQVERMIMSTLAALRDGIDEMRPIADEAARTDVAYKTAFAKARITARADQTRRVTNDEADDIATRNTETERLAYKIAEHRLLVQREANRALQERLGGLRTLHAGIRDQAGTN